MAEATVAEVPHSKLKVEIARLLKQEGYISDYVVEGRTPKVLRVYLKYTGENEPVIRGIKRESRPGLRNYAAADEVPRVLGGLGVAMLSTSSGILTDKEARAKHVGGEVLCSVW
jgi:small subunit ribosomal protein S8